MPASAGRACPTGPAPREVLLLVQAIDGCCYPLRCESATVGNRIVLGSIAELNANARQQLHNDLLAHGEPMKVTRAAQFARNASVRLVRQSGIPTCGLGAS